MSFDEQEVQASEFLMKEEEKAEVEGGFLEITNNFELKEEKLRIQRIDKRDSLFDSDSLLSPISNKGFNPSIL